VALVRGGPDGRRRALDRFAYGLLPVFGAIARRFDEALEQRNRVLKDARVDWTLLDSFAVPYASAAAALVRARREACARWAPALRRYAEKIGGAEHARAALDVTATYKTELDLARDADLEEHILQSLAAARDREERRHSTAVGPHHDDLVLEKDEHKARYLASQGEARALVLAMKLAAVELYGEARGAAPLLLLDDVAGELDPDRQQRLFQTVAALGAQTFVTATHAGALPALEDARVWHVEAGRVEIDSATAAARSSHPT
jgi:DNA replication and repair protein RecF